VCNDLDVTGVEFYLMDFIAGEAHRDPRMPAVERPAVAVCMRPRSTYLHSKPSALFGNTLDVFARVGLELFDARVGR
jgi:hypothetical protein